MKTKTRKKLTESIVRNARPVANRGNMAYSGKTGGDWMRAAMNTWGALVESTDGFAPIENSHTKRVAAALLDNQTKHFKRIGALNESAPAVNTQVFGPNYGVTGGALHSGDTFATGDFRNPVTFMQVIRRVFPELIANDIVGVQPMPNSTCNVVAIRYKYLKGANAPADSSVHHVHTEGGKQTRTAAGTEKGMDSYDSKGLRGIETRYQYDASARKLILVDRDGFPVAHELVIVLPNDDVPGKFTVMVNPLVTRLIGDIEIPEHDGTFAGARKAGQDAVNAMFVGGGGEIKNKGFFNVGISGDGNPAASAIDGKGAEIGWHKVDTRFTGAENKALANASFAGGRIKFRPEDTGVAAWLGDYEGTGATARAAFDFKKTYVEAGIRKIATSWTPELEEDLRNNSGIDINEQGLTCLAYELTAEIDRELVVRMMYCALYNEEYSLWSGENADARWAGERARALYMDLIKCSIRMQTRNHRGPANFIIVTPDVAAALEGLSDFVSWTAESSVSTSNMAATKAGTLGGNRFTVYIDTKSPVYNGEDYGYGLTDLFAEAAEGTPGMPNYALLGYKGAESWDTGIIYCPYIPLMLHEAMDPYSFSKQIGLSTRYGIVDNIFGAELYYHMVIIDSLTQPGIDKSLKKFFPAGYVPASIAREGLEVPAGFAIPVRNEVQA